MMDGLVFISHSSLDKAIADAICHRLEAQGIRCWIAPRDITKTDWAGSIMDGLRRSDVFVVVISHNSIPSPEVTKEVTEATRTCKYLLPFKVDEDALSDRLRYHLGPCHWLDAVDPPLERRIDELISRIRHLSEEDAVYVNHAQWKLTERVVWPHGLFVGRDEELRTIREMLSAEHILFLQGMGGIGKSEIAKGYAKAYRDAYDTIIFANFATDLMDMICGDDITVENLRRADGENRETWFRRKLDAFRSVSDEKTLLIVDNFDTDDDPQLDELLSCPAHILFTTRNDHSGYPTLNVEKINDFDQVRKIFFTHYGRPVKDTQTVDEILRLVDCHTITVELIAKQMKASFLKPEQMLQRLKSTGLNTQLREKVRREGAEEKRSAFDYISGLFRFSRLTEAEEHILCCMCFVPHQGIRVGDLGDILELEDYDPVNSLITNSWLTLDDESDTLRIHPVICDVVKAQLQPTQENCRDYLHGLYEHKTKNFWNLETAERNSLYPLVVKVLEDYPIPPKELLTEYHQFTQCGWICGDFERSIREAHILYDFVMKEYGDGTEEAGDAAFGVATSYFNAGLEAESDPWYELCLTNREKALDAHDRQLAVAHTKVARNYLRIRDFAGSHAHFDKAVEIFDYIIEHKAFDTPGPYPYYYGAMLMEQSRLFLAEGDLERALEQSRFADSVFIAAGEKGRSDRHYTLVDMGTINSLLGNYDAAEELLRQAAALDEELLDPKCTAAIETKEAVADNCLRRGDAEKARQLYSDLEMELEKDYGPDYYKVAELRKKREAIH